jgi:hypothetical protein
VPGIAGLLLVSGAAEAHQQRHQSANSNFALDIE